MIVLEKIIQHYTNLLGGNVIIEPVTFNIWGTIGNLNIGNDVYILNMKSELLIASHGVFDPNQVFKARVEITASNQIYDFGVEDLNKYKDYNHRVFLGQLNFRIYSPTQPALPISTKADLEFVRISPIITNANIQVATSVLHKPMLK